ncbi:DNA polymerase III subunit beta, partial [Candidatus Parcubacteria bacterium]|nr:DNA polymerase III subunit beta [Candidatus Parcubacteria bacterium]
TQENLHYGLSIVGNITNNNPNLPILNNILIKTENRVITLTVTNLEIAVNCIIRGKVEENGNFTVPARIFLDYINLLNRGQVKLELDKNELKITSPNSKTKIKGEPAEDFPVIPEIKKDIGYAVNVNSLKDAIAQVIFAAAISSPRPEINGLVFNFNSHDSELTIAATDSYRLAEKIIKLQPLTKERADRKIIIHNKMLHELLRILNNLKNIKNEDEKVKIYLSDNNQVLFAFSDSEIGTGDSVELFSRLIEGDYPEYKEIIPKNYNTRVIVNKQDLIKIVKANSLFTQSGVNSIKMEFSVKDNQLSVFSANAQAGESFSNLPIKIEGDKNEITLNYRYLLDGLQHIDGDDVILEIIDKNTPCLLKPIDQRDYIYIIMPIKL